MLYIESSITNIYHVVDEKRIEKYGAESLCNTVHGFFEPGLWADSGVLWPVIVEKPSDGRRLCKACAKKASLNVGA